MAVWLVREKRRKILRLFTCVHEAYKKQQYKKIKGGERTGRRVVFHSVCVEKSGEGTSRLFFFSFLQLYNELNTRTRKNKRFHQEGNQSAVAQVAPSLAPPRAHTLLFSE